MIRTLIWTMGRTIIRIMGPEPVIVTRLIAAVLCSIVLTLLSPRQTLAGADDLTEGRTIAGFSPERALQLGKDIYRRGILPSGEPMQAFVKGDVPVDGTAFTCSSCHLRGGLGSIEGQVYTPPTNGRKLFQPLPALYKNVEIISLPPRRPAYTDESLAAVLRSGVDPTGRVLHNAMPRYLLQDDDMALLIFYLKALSSEFSPGFSANTLRFATVITDEVRPEDRDRLLIPLENLVVLKNRQAAIYETNPKQARMADAMIKSKEAANVRISLAQWLLKGPPDTWRSQLDEYYRTEPVFALLGGITTGEWKPVHDFSEANQLPCLFPITDFPAISESDWYTLYLSKGYYQEGASVAHYMNNETSLQKGRIVQVVRASREGKALFAGFQQAWNDQGRQAPVTITLEEGTALTKDFLEQLLEKEKPHAIVLWIGPGDLNALEILAANRQKPEMVFVSSGYLGKSIWTLSEHVRDFTLIAYPFRLPQDEIKYAEYARTLIGNTQVTTNGRETLGRVYSLIAVLTQALMDMKGNFYRDNFLDVIGMMPDQNFPLYERLSFGPGQRYASKGCYIVKLTKGPNPELIRKSDWVIH